MIGCSALAVNIIMRGCSLYTFLCLVLTNVLIRPAATAAQTQIQIKNVRFLFDFGFGHNLTPCCMSNIEMRINNLASHTDTSSRGCASLTCAMAFSVLLQLVMVNECTLRIGFWYLNPIDICVCKTRTSIKVFCGKLW